MFGQNPYLRVVLVVLGLAFFSGCTTYQIIPHQKDFWTNHNQSIGVAVAPIPTPVSHKAGSQGLLDLAINNANSSDLDKHLGTMDVSDKINKLADDLVAYLNERNFNAKRISGYVKDWTINNETPEQQDDEFGSDKKSGESAAAVPAAAKKIANEHGVDKLLLISVNAVGTIRSYYGFIPTSSPEGYAHIDGKLMNLKNNKVEWEHFNAAKVPYTTTEWDTPPDFPGLSEAMQKAVDDADLVIYNHFIQ